MSFQCKQYSLLYILLEIDLKNDLGKIFKKFSKKFSKKFQKNFQKNFQKKISKNFSKNFQKNFKNKIFKKNPCRVLVYMTKNQYHEIQHKSTLFSDRIIQSPKILYYFIKNII